MGAAGGAGEAARPAVSPVRPASSRPLAHLPKFGTTCHAPPFLLLLLLLPPGLGAGWGGPAAVPARVCGGAAAAPRPARAWLSRRDPGGAGGQEALNYCNCLSLRA